MLRILEEPIISIFSEEHPEDKGPSETPVLVCQHVWESHSMQVTSQSSEQPQTASL